MDTSVILPAIREGETLLEKIEKVIINLFKMPIREVNDNQHPLEMERYELKSRTGDTTSAVYIGRDDRGNYQFAYSKMDGLLEVPRRVTVNPHDVIINGRVISARPYLTMEKSVFKREKIHPLEYKKESEYLLSKIRGAKL